MASVHFRIYLYGCPGCGTVEGHGREASPLCLDPDCERFTATLLPWRAFVRQIERLFDDDGESWKGGHD